MENILNNENVYEEDTQKGRYLTFTLDDNVYGISIKQVIEIIGIQDITKVPETPDYLKGIINLRGKIVPLIDVRLKFGRAPMEYNDRTCIIIVEMENLTVGLIVDKVEDVIDIGDDKIAKAPDEHIGFENRYIEGIGQLDNQIVIILDVKKILRTEEVDILEKVSENGDIVNE